MKQAFWIIVITAISISSVYAKESELTTFVQYKKGAPIILNLSYKGGLMTWDAGASISNGTLVLTNSMFISITSITNVDVKPISDKVLSVWADTYFRKPFSLVLDISRFYDLSTAGKYIVRWGCVDVKEDRFFIEIID